MCFPRFKRQVFPAPENDPFNEEIGFANLESIARNLSDSGIATFVIPTVVERKELIHRYVAAVGANRCLVVWLNAPIETIHNRIRRRESDEHSLKWHLGRSGELQTILAKSGAFDIELDTSQLSPDEVAQQILEML